jgi:hypothetical protein
MLGRINDHMLAATITPDAKPNRVLWAMGEDAIRRLGKNTMAAPRRVPIKGRSRMGNIIVGS